MKIRKAALERLFCILLTVAALSAPAMSSGGTQVTVCAAQRLTVGAAFDPDTAPAAAGVSPGDVVVLTVGFRNDTAASVDITGFSAKINYDKTKVAPYTGSAPFSKKPYQISKELLLDYGWSSAGNSKDNFVMLAAASARAYSVKTGSTLVLGRVAFRVNANASGAAEFVFDVAGQNTSVNDAKQKLLTLDASQPFRLTIDGYSISAVARDHVTLTNPGPVTLALAYFDAGGKFLSADIRRVSANAGTFPVTPVDAYTVSAALLDDDCRPLYVYG